MEFALITKSPIWQLNAMIEYSHRFLTFCIYQTRKNQEEIDKYIAEIERNNRIIKENDDIMKELEIMYRLTNEIKTTLTVSSIGPTSNRNHHIKNTPT